MLRVGLIGTGYFSHFHLEGWSSVKGAEVVAVCDTDPARAQAMAHRFGVAAVHDSAQRMLDHEALDLLDVVTPPATHPALIALAAQRRLPTICQKPLAPDLEQAREMTRLMATAGAPLIVHENFRFSPWYREARRLIDAGAMGRLHSVMFRLRPGDGQGDSAYLARQPYFQQMPRFLVHETAVHFIDTFRYLMGEVTAVTASLRRINPVIAGEDAGYIIFHFQSGATGLFDGNRLNEHEATDLRRTMGQMWLEGSAGVLRLDGEGRLHWQPHGGSSIHHEYDRGPDTFAGGACARLQQHVVDYLLGEGPVENTAQDYLRNLQIVEAVYQSSASGQRMPLDNG